MNRKTKDCGSCAFFFKWKADIYGGGLCDLLDARTKTDHGHSCKHWSGIKYERTPKHIIRKQIAKEQKSP